jgi:uncharacterized membrane protein
MRRFKIQSSARESGQSLVLMAMVIAFVIVPLMALVIEVGRWIYVRGTLQHAADAAATAASQAWDLQTFETTGVVRFDAVQAGYAAQAAFAAGVTDAAERRYQPSLSSWWLDESDHTAHVQAQASVTPLFPFAPTVVIHVSSVAQAGQESSAP